MKKMITTAFLAIAGLAKDAGKKVKLTDSGKNLDQKLLANLKKYTKDIQIGQHTKEFIQSSDLVVISPGVDTKKFKKKKLRLWPGS